MAISAIVLFLVTWRLWTPQTSVPQIPFSTSLVHCPGAVDWIAFVVLVSGALAVAISLIKRNSSYRVLRTAGLLGWLISYLVLLALNQHRLQPWAYQFFLLGFFALTMEPRRFLASARILLISIYAYSSFSKFDFQFAQTVGWQINETLLSMASVDTEGWSVDEKWRAAFVSASSEAAAAFLLAIPSKLTRTLGLVLAVGMHLALLLALGPLGLNHHLPVLIWNAFFVVQLMLLFSPFWFWQHSGSLEPPPSPAESIPPSTPVRRAAVLGTIVFWVAILLPIGTIWQVTDHWPAWELYSPRASRCELAGPNLPTNIPQRGNAKFGTLNQWSLEKLGVPIYPQARFQVGVALAIEKELNRDENQGFTIEVKSVSSRWEGKRDSVVYGGFRPAPYRFEDARSKYLLNTEARSLFQLMTTEKDR